MRAAEVAAGAGQPATIAAGPVVSAATAAASVSLPASTSASSTPNAVSMPLMPLDALPNSTSLSTTVCGA